jgi:PAS domain S-box-containing protein
MSFTDNKITGKDAGSRLVSVKIKFLSYILPAIIIFTGLVSILISGFAQNLMIKHELSGFNQILHKNSEKLRQCIYNRDFSKISELLGQAFYNQKVQSIRIINENNEQAVTFNNQLASASKELKKHSHKILMKGPQNKNELWRIEIEYDSSQFKEQVDYFVLLQIAIIGLMSIGLIIGTFIAFDSLFLPPVNQIATACSSMLEGRDDFKMPYHIFNDEVGQAVEKVNQLIRFIRYQNEHIGLCLQKSNSVYFSYDTNYETFSFYADKLPGLEIETSDLKRPEDLWKLFRPKIECKEFWYDIQDRMNSEKEGSLSHDFELKKPDEGSKNEESEPVWLRMVFCWQKGGDKVICGGIINNISTEMNRLSFLSQQESNYKRIYDQCPVGIWRTRGEKFVYLNQAMASLLGYQSPEEAKSKIKSITHQIYLNSEDRTFFYDEMKKHGFVENCEVRFKQKNGNIYWAALSGRLFHDDNGLYSEGTCINIDERKKADEKLRVNEEDIRLSLESSGFLAYRLDFTDKSFKITGAVQKLLGVEEDSISTLDEFKKLIYPRDVERFPVNFDYFQKHSHPPVIDIRFCCMSKAGAVQVKWFRVCFAFFAFSKHNRPGLQRGIIYDFTPELELEKKLEAEKEKALAVSRSKSEFIADISHEIRTPLNAILGFSELLASALAGGENENYINSILTASRNLLNLINDILDLSRLDSGRFEIDLNSVSIEAIAREINSMFKIEAQNKNLELNVEVGENVPPVLALDEVRFKQILNNLVYNAIKFTEKGKIDVVFTASTVDKNNCTDLCVEVIDTGQGIDIAERELVFEPFYLKKGHKASVGSGLGLAISKKLAQMMNGEILLKSEPDAGSKFELRLHKVQIQTLADHLQSDEGKNANLFKFYDQSVLVADDASSNRELLFEALKGAGLQVYAAHNGNQAVELALEHKPDLVIMDIRMPEKDGIEATREIKAATDIPVIALTASVSPLESESSAGLFDGYLHKPVKLYDLFSESGRFLKFTLDEAEESDSSTEQEIPSIAYEQIVKPHSLIDKIDEGIVGRLDSFSGAIEMDKLEKFAAELKAIALEHRFNLLGLEAEELYQSVKKFDIPAINRNKTRVKATLTRFLSFWKN